MAQLSDNEIASYALFLISLDDEIAATMTAIALAESGGNTNAHNAVPPDDSYGLWQINMYGPLGPARRRDLGLSSNTELFNPQTNAKAAKYVYDRQGFRAWSVYTNNKYQQYMQRGRAAVDATSGSSSDKPISERVGDVLSDPTGLIGIFNPLVDSVLSGFTWIGNPANWIRILQVGGGIVLAIVAANIVVSNTGVKDTANKAALKVVSKGVL